MAANDALSRGRAAFEQEAWAEACAQLSAADRQHPLEPEDLDRLAMAAHLVGDEAVRVDALTRAHTGHLARGEVQQAARSAFWLAFAALDHPDQQAVGSGWLARVQRLLEGCPRDCAERGFWLCATGFRKIGEGDLDGAREAFDEAARIGAACGDPDLIALARQAVARVLLRLRHTAEGLAALDEVMVAVTCGEVGAVVAGVVYCSVIGACHEVFDLGRAQEWTAALAGWCAAHPDMVPFRTPCLIRRSELLQLRGEWDESIDEARRACERAALPTSQHDAGAAYYQLAELHRLRGEFDEADAAYRRASVAGRKPHPGLALLRLAQHQMEAAVTAVRRGLAETRSPRVRIDVLRASVIVMLQARDLDAARTAADELDRLAGEIGAPFLQAAAAAASGAVRLAEGVVDSALPALSQAVELWKAIDAPYELARARVLVGEAYRQRGDDDGARMEFEAAQEIFERLDAAPDAAMLTQRLARWSPQPAAGLTGREVEVLRLVATGRSNRAIGAELAISEKTVARHISNIFTKLDLSSRSAATAYAYEHKLL